MADAFRLAPMLLIAVAAGAAAEPMGPSVRAQSAGSIRAEEPEWKWRHPVVEQRRFQDDFETLPAWDLPFGAGASERDRRGLRFSVRPGRGVKATAKLRF